MARTVKRLSALRVKQIKTPGLYADGGGLLLQCTGAGAKSWVFRFVSPSRVYPPLNPTGKPHKRAGRKQAREMGLGSYPTVTLEAARERADSARAQCSQGLDPIDARDRMYDSARLEAASAVTFAECAARYIESHKAGWRNPKHIAQWASTIKSYANPVFGSLPVQAVNTALVMKALEPIWAEKPETAGRLRGRIETILDWATVRGFRAGENPARWRGHLAKLLPAKARLQLINHHAAMSVDDLPAFIAELRKQEGIAARALEFAILTAGRTGEVIGARPGEFDRAAGVWTVPANRMKTHRAHRVPLAPRSRAIYDERTEDEGEFLFPGRKPSKPLSNMAMLALLQRMGRGDLTTHGFRSTFRDWAAERTRYPREIVEIALSHTLADKTEAAYQRSDLLDKRRPIMEAWAKFCNTPIADKGSKILPMKRQG